MDANESIGSAWAAGDHCDARLTGGLAVCLCHVGSAAFLAGNDGFDGAVIEPIKHWQEALAWDEVCALDVVRCERFSDGGANMATSHSFQTILFL